MRLEREHERRPGKLARAARASPPSRRVMAVVVDQRERAAARERHVAVALEAAAHALELGERLRDRRVGTPTRARSRSRPARSARCARRQRELDREIGRRALARRSACAPAVRDVAARNCASSASRR
jgi:hypothetical protein